KLVVHGEDRAAALRRLADSLAAYEIVGVATNVAFLQRVVAHEAFASGNVDTGLIARNHAALFPLPAPLPDDMLLAAALSEMVTLVAARASVARTSADPQSPWHAVDSWWPNSRLHAVTLVFNDGEVRHEVSVRGDGAPWRVSLRTGEVAATVVAANRHLDIATGNAEFRATVVAQGE